MSRDRINRRGFLTGTVAAGSVVAIVPSTAREFSGEVHWEPGAASPPVSPQPGPLRFFKADEYSFIEAAIDRLIPPDDWPGAKDLGVARFLDDQLAGSFGRADVWYMQGPWPKGLDTQGYQSRLNPAQHYRTAIAAIDVYAREKFSGKRFSELSVEDQDAVLKGMEKGEFELKGADAKTFFDLLLQNTIEGYFGDPVYGGNRDMMAWKMIGFPGARYDYRPYVKQHNQKLEIEPVSVAGTDSFGRRKPKE
ncbi:MAG: gluconate 2-dehydrogenase subunit 3 family protein [Rhizobiales bacterium]|nr:gluconate 2-dehydrogenase subunit 3 family protein [Hyphomicrobiales bacterium]